jgi:sugar phosphate permease
MNQEEKSYSKPFLGWWIVLVTGILSGLGIGFITYGFSALFKPIAAELGFTRAATSFAAGIGRLEGGFDAPITGWFVDRFGPRWVMVVGIMVMSLGLALMNFISSLLTYYIVWGLIVSVGQNVSLTVTVDKTLTNWFVKKRGLAVGIKFALIGLIGVLILPVVTWLCVTYGWRFTCLIWAAVMLLGVPLAGFFVKQKRPEYYGLLPDGAQVGPASEEKSKTTIDRGIEYASSFQETEFTLRQAMRTSAYWILVVIYGCHMIIAGGLTIHCIPFLTDMGISPTIAGGMMGIMVFSTIPSRFLSGYLADRTTKGRLQFLLAGSFALEVIGFSAFLFYPTIQTVYILLITYGLGSGAPTTMIIVMLGRYFGRKAYGSIYGTSNLFRMPVSLLAPVFTGWVFDRTGSYKIAIMIFMLIALLATLIICFIRPPKAPDQITDIHHII